MLAAAAKERWRNEAGFFRERMGRLPLLAEDEQKDPQTNQPAHFGHPAFPIRGDRKTGTAQTCAVGLLVQADRRRASHRLPDRHRLDPDRPTSISLLSILARNVKGELRGDTDEL